MYEIVILQKSPLFAFLFIDLLFIYLFLPSKVFMMQNLKKNNQEQIQSDTNPCHQPCQHQKGKKEYTYDRKYMIKRKQLFPK